MNSKDILAKLLAGENITVMRDSVPTASFDINNRILRLPVWDNMSEDVEDTLIAHEIAHAKYTFPELFIREDIVGVKHTIMNILEDNRIERLIKEEYPIYKRIFNSAYRELFDSGLFGESPKTNILDKINVFSKVGTYSGVDFTDKERILFDKVNSTVSPQDCLDLLEEFYNMFLYPEEESKPKSEGEVTDDADEVSPGDSSTEFSYDIFEKSIGKLSDTTSKYINYSTANKWNFYGDVYVPYSRIFDDVAKTFSSDDIEKYNSLVDDYLVETRNQVMSLVKEFEMRKAADKYKRTATSRSGELNSKKLFSYKINDNIFKVNEIVKDGKNHGLFVLVDWSQSMADNILKVIDQIINLALFCKKCGIVFTVCAFSGDIDNGRKSLPKHTENKIMTTVHLVELFTSSMTNPDMNYMIKLLKSGIVLRTKEYMLKNTPLNMALLYTNDYLYKMKIMNGLTNVSLLLISDGDDMLGISTSHISDTFKTMEEDNNVRSTIVDSVTKLNYNLPTSFTLQRNVIMQMIKDRCKCNVLVFYLLDEKTDLDSVAYGFKLENIEEHDGISTSKSPFIDKFFFIHHDKDIQTLNDKIVSGEEFSSVTYRNRNSRIFVNKFIKEIA